MKFSDTLKELDQISAQLKDQGITVEKLDRAIVDLKEHQGNIEKIEDNIDAIKQEVIGPIHAELEQNKVAGRFSIFGFWVGALGLVVSIATIFFQAGSALPSLGSTGNAALGSTSNAAIIEKLELIERQLLFPKGTDIQAGEVFVERGSRIKLASDGDKGIFLNLDSVTDWPKGNGLKGGVKLFRESNQIGRAPLEKGLLRSDGKPGLRDWFNDDTIGLAEGDSLTIGNVKLQVIRIFSTEPVGRLIGDDKNGMAIRIGGGSGA